MEMGGIFSISTFEEGQNRMFRYQNGAERRKASTYHRTYIGRNKFFLNEVCKLEAQRDSSKGTVLIFTQ